MGPYGAVLILRVKEWRGGMHVADEAEKISRSMRKFGPPF